MLDSEPVPCAFCPAIARHTQITRSDDLQQILVFIASAIGGRKLVVDSGSPARSDVIESELHCAGCGRRFELVCETYHGRGGHWRAIDTTGAD